MVIRFYLNMVFDMKITRARKAPYIGAYTASTTLIVAPTYLDSWDRRRLLA